MIHEPGYIVKSKAGRDKGRYFMIYSWDGKDYAYLVDGGLRKISSPKKKKIRHIEPTGTKLHNLAEKIIKGMKIFDSELRKALEEAGYGNSSVEG